MTGAEVEQLYYDLVAHVRVNVGIPIAVKLSPFFSAMANVARELVDAGADALVLFNRFYQPDFDLENLEVTPALTLSTPQELLLRLHWVAILYGQHPGRAGGHRRRPHGHARRQVPDGRGQVAMMTSALLKHGIGHLTRVRDDLVTVDGGARVRVDPPDAGQHEPACRGRPSAFERANYMKVLRSYALREPPRGGRV